MSFLDKGTCSKYPLKRARMEIPRATSVWRASQWASVFPAFPCYCANLILQFKNTTGTSLVVQWLRIRLPMWGTQVRSLIWGDSTCLRATKSMCHSYFSHLPQLLKPTCLEPVLCNKRSHRNEKPTHCNEKPTHHSERKPVTAMKTPCAPTKTQHSQRLIRF